MQNNVNRTVQWNRPWSSITFYSFPEYSHMSNKNIVNIKNNQPLWRKGKKKPNSGTTYSGKNDPLLPNKRFQSCQQQCYADKILRRSYYRERGEELRQRGILAKSCPSLGRQDARRASGFRDSLSGEQPRGTEPISASDGADDAIQEYSVLWPESRVRWRQTGPEEATLIGKARGSMSASTFVLHSSVVRMGALGAEERDAKGE